MDQPGSARGAAETDRKVSHPCFARILPGVVARAQARGQGDHRRALLAGLSGRVIEVGAGTGINFGYYPPSVTDVVAVEPEVHLRRLAADAARTAPVPVRVLDGLAERLPVTDGSFDAGVVSLVLCSVYDPDRALAELFRAIRPGGELRFYEHVLAAGPWLSRLQRLLDRLFWPHMAGGCHCGRSTGALIQQAGFAMEEYRRFTFRPCAFLFHVSPHILGKARRRR
jgi:SAM-dependent methyltransferase